MESYARDVICVSLEGQDGGRIGRFDIVELDCVVTGGGEVALVRGDAEAVYLTVRMRDCARADAAERFPEAGVDRLVPVREGELIWMRTGLYGRNQL